MQMVLQPLGIRPVNSGAGCGPTDGWLTGSGPERVSFSPIDGQPIAAVRQADGDDYEAVMARAREAFHRWRRVPAPRRGQIVRAMGDALRSHKAELGALVTLEAGKIVAEGEGEVQEMIDMADFAVGLSRQLYGKTMQSERPDHRMYEQWHPLGAVGVVTAFNFPVAVWAWNAFLAAVCGDVVVWKPSSKTPLTAIAVHHLIAPILERHDLAGVFNLVIGQGSAVGERMISDPRLPLISATGSCRMGRQVGMAVAKRYGRSILELGGNNAVIVCADANQDLALRATLFGAVGTAGQRCTSTRRLFVQRSIHDAFVAKLVKAYDQVTIGDPRAAATLMGPLIDGNAVDEMQSALAAARSQGGEVIYGGNRVDGVPGGFYVQPTLVAAANDLPIVQAETFAPILYLIPFDDLEEAIAQHNDVPQGLSSAIFTESLANAERFLSSAGSDCGIANVNIGTSGAEIGGAFGGEKETGGGREAGSDAWKAYMRRQTNTINYGRSLPLAQGIHFDI
ncbi:MAG: aldehyde dehydrogenase family protein [Desulfosarcinaceae bacterium]|nr:aldehyde dehydrogenase family protein [Desulfosarcinaceae bacterium]